MGTQETFDRRNEDNSERGIKHSTGFVSKRFERRQRDVERGERNRSELVFHKHQTFFWQKCLNNKAAERENDEGARNED